MLSYSKNPSADTSLHAGPHDDIYDDTSELNVSDHELLQRSDVDTRGSEMLPGDIGNALQLISGIDLDRNLDDGEYWTTERALDVINQTRGFIKTQLGRVLNLHGFIARISQALFEVELQVFNDLELETYCDLFRLDTSHLDPDESDYREALIFFVLEFNYWVLERLRHWQWRDEVFFNNAGVEFQEFPGHSILEFENTEQLHLNGPDRYYPRAGSITREFLLNNFEYFDLCHMAGFIALGADKPFVLVNDTNPIQISDLIIAMLYDFPEIDPRTFITPFGPRRVHNSEPLEKIHNFNRISKTNLILTEKRASLVDAAFSAGLTIHVCSDDNNLIDDQTLEKPTYAIAEEVAAQYLSPQFFTGVEGHRSYLSALTNYIGLSGKPITDYEEGSIVFYGVGYGTGFYRFYTWSELNETFSRTMDYIDPMSIAKHPENPQLWSRFSHQSITRLRRVILPFYHRKYNLRSELNNVLISLESTFLDIDQLRVVQSKNYRYVYQDSIMSTLKSEYTINIHRDSSDVAIRKREVERGITTFFLQLFNIGSQLADWDENFAGNGMVKDSQNQIREFIENGEYHYLAPEHSDDLHSKIISMLTYEFEEYANIPGEHGNLKHYLLELRFVRFFEDRFCVAYSDELESIGGRLTLMIDALKFGYFDFVQTTGYWLIYTAVYYMETLFEESPFAKMLDLKV